MKKFILGIGGYIGSGKSTVARLFGRFTGAFVIDADKVVDQLYQPGAEGLKKIKDFFGDEYLRKDGRLNRKKMAKIVFNDPKKLKILHALIHPLVTAYVQKFIDKSPQKLIVLESTYFEPKFLGRFISALLWVETAQDVAFARIAKKRLLPKNLFERTLRLQVKPSKIDFIISNDGSLKELEAQIFKICERILSKSA